MSTKSHNAKKPKLAHPPVSHADGADAMALPGTEGAKHHVSFAQHQHEQQAGVSANVRLQQEPPEHHLKSDAQQHQQKNGSHK
jgi:hypothetical protein